MRISVRKNLGFLDRSIRIVFGILAIIEGILGYCVYYDMVGRSTYRRH